MGQSAYGKNSTVIAVQHAGESIDSSLVKEEFFSIMFLICFNENDFFLILQISCR